MDRSIETILAQALQLEPGKRAALAAELISSLDGGPDQDVEAAWSAELERRKAALDAGAMKLEPWSDVKRRIERELLHK